MRSTPSIKLTLLFKEKIFANTTNFNNLNTSQATVKYS